MCLSYKPNIKTYCCQHLLSFSFKLSGMAIRQLFNATSLPNVIKRAGNKDHFVISTGPSNPAGSNALPSSRYGALVFVTRFSSGSRWSPLMRLAQVLVTLIVSLFSPLRMARVMSTA